MSSKVKCNWLYTWTDIFSVVPQLILRSKSEWNFKRVFQYACRHNFHNFCLIHLELLLVAAELNSLEKCPWFLRSVENFRYRKYLFTESFVNRTETCSPNVRHFYKSRYFNVYVCTPPANFMWIEKKFSLWSLVKVHGTSAVQVVERRIRRLETKQ